MVQGDYSIDIVQTIMERNQGQLRIYPGTIEKIEELLLVLFV